MKKDFKSNYPGELLPKDAYPSPVYLATVVHMLGLSVKLAWQPWQQILSEEKHDEMMEARGGRRPRSDDEVLQALTQFDVPQLSENDISGSLYFVQTILQIRRNTFALTVACHLASHKLLDEKFLAAYTQRVNPKLGFRRVNTKQSKRTASSWAWCILWRQRTAGVSTMRSTNSPQPVQTSTRSFSHG